MIGKQEKIINILNMTQLGHNNYACEKIEFFYKK